jgi:uncharacterized protein with HEPN domain
MPSADPEARLRHILENIDAIIAATRGKSHAEITSNYLVQRALERAVEIISEAAKTLPAEFREREPDVPWSEIIGIGNLLRHEYYRIRGDRMLDILTKHLPRLRPAIVRLRSSIGATKTED